MAALIALTAWTGLIVQVDASTALAGNVGDALWVMLRFFTIWTNLLVALLFTALALGMPLARRPALIAGIMLAILLVGVVYALLLRGTIALSGGAVLADYLLHYATPMITPLYWLLFVPKGQIDQRAPWYWAAYPIIYFLYALVRGAGDGIYPYPFIDLSALGIGRVLANAAAIGTLFLLAGFALRALDRRFATLRPAARNA